MTFDIVAWFLANPEVGWIGVLAYLYFEIRTRWGRVKAVEEKIVAHTTVVRAMARVHPNIDEEKVDGYLVENGHEPGDFIDDAGQESAPDDEDYPVPDE